METWRSHRRVVHILRSTWRRADCKPERTRRHCRQVNQFIRLIGADMLHYAVVFFIIALIAAFFGFGGIAVGAAGIAKVLFVIFLIGAVVSFLMSMGRRV
jgi:uncharacterized membrane protein YtjA (UPF0391 family)